MKLDEISDFKGKVEYKNDLISSITFTESPSKILKLVYDYDFKGNYKRLTWFKNTTTLAQVDLEYDDKSNAFVATKGELYNLWFVADVSDFDELTVLLLFQNKNNIVKSKTVYGSEVLEVSLDYQYNKNNLPEVFDITWKYNGVVEDKVKHKFEYIDCQ